MPVRRSPALSPTLAPPSSPVRSPLAKPIEELEPLSLGSPADESQWLLDQDAMPAQTVVGVCVYVMYLCA